MWTIGYRVTTMYGCLKCLSACVYHEIYYCVYFIYVRIHMHAHVYARVSVCVCVFACVRAPACVSCESISVCICELDVMEIGDTPRHSENKYTYLYGSEYLLTKLFTSKLIDYEFK